MTQLDDVVTFLGKAGTVTVKHIEDAGSPHLVASGNRILVYEPRMTSTDWGILRYVYDYPCEMDVDSEANCTTLYNGLLTNIDKLNRRETIATYTKPATLIWADLVDFKLKIIKASAKARIKATFTLRVEWSTA